MRGIVTAGGIGNPPTWASRSSREVRGTGNQSRLQKDRWKGRSRSSDQKSTNEMKREEF